MQHPEPMLWKTVRRPGLTTEACGVDALLERLPKKWGAYRYKGSGAWLWVVHVGGTGTGKSTIFNALCGKDLSDTGLERPKTFGPIAYVHRDAAIEKDFPFASMEMKRLTSQGPSFAPAAGAPGELLVLEHEREDLSHLVLVDLPDIDSLEVKNRQTVDDLYLLSDLIVFVTSQEKYADEVPFQFLERMHQEGKPFLLLLNKADRLLTMGEILTTVDGHGLSLDKDQAWTFPYFPSHQRERISQDPAFRDFATAFFELLSKGKMKEWLLKERKRAAGELSRDMKQLLELLSQEEYAAANWLEHLDVFFRSACRDLFDDQERHFREESREHLQNEIRKLYAKYDVLGKPRRFIAQLILSPLRLLGLGAAEPQDSREALLLRIRKRMDVTPILAAVTGFNRSVLEKLSPADDRSPLFKKLRERDLILGDEEVRRYVLDEQVRLLLWLEERFQGLADGIPKTTQWGIYSTSILWGGLILSLEVAVGGGISLLEAVLDSAVAPFVTRGAVELFAYQEVQKVARELAERYRESLTSVVRRQRDRYAACLETLRTPQETLGALRSLQSSI